MLTVLLYPDKQIRIPPENSGIEYLDVEISLRRVIVKPRILVLAGSTRSGSLNRRLAAHAAATLREAGLAATLVELRQYPLPIYDGDFETENGLPANAKALKALARDHDAFAIAAPEYNGSFPAVLKNAIDWMSRPEPGEPPLAAFRGKTAALMSASPGPGGGRRVLHALRELLEGIRVTVIPEQVSVPLAEAAFDSEGRLVRAEALRAVRSLSEGLVAQVGQATGLPSPAGAGL
jgi:chromate reductase, NAD(P)H dehydrogenase (quinone)